MGSDPILDSDPNFSTGGVMARKPDRAVRRQEILEHFYEVLASEGLEGASNSKLARHMDINPSLIYHYFSSKEALICELVDYLAEQYKRNFSPVIDTASEPGERLELIVKTLFSRDWVQLIDMGAFYSCYALSFRNERVRDSLRGMYVELRRWLAAEISALMEAGVVAGTDPEKLADAVISLLEGYDFYRCLMGEEERFDELGEFLEASAINILRTGEAGS